MNYKSEVLIQAQTDEVVRRLHTVSAPLARKSLKGGKALTTDGEAPPESYVRERVTSLISTVFPGRSRRRTSLQRDSKRDRSSSVPGIDPTRECSCPRRGGDAGNRSSNTLEAIPSSRALAPPDSSGPSFLLQQQGRPEVQMAAHV